MLLIQIITKTTIIKIMILKMVAKAQAAKARAVVILILVPPPLIMGGFIKGIGAYKSKHVGYG